MQIRDADAARDAAACAAIYEPFVTGSAVSFEERAPTPEELAERIARTAASYPWLVAESDGAVAGFAYAGQHRVRAAYRWAVEVSVYVDAAHRRQGVGRRLYETLLPLLERQGLMVALAGITLPNDASVALHVALGFEPVGVYRAVGYKGGAWRDVGWWQLQLADPGPDGPAEVGPPVRLDAPVAD
jgi:L-amino acid N-acyltransferase YncA